MPGTDYTKHQGYDATKLYKTKEYIGSLYSLALFLGAKESDITWLFNW